MVERVDTYLITADLGSDTGFEIWAVEEGYDNAQQSLLEAITYYKSKYDSPDSTWEANQQVRIWKLVGET